MQVFTNIQETKGLCVNAITWASFDGVHRGHWKILAAMRNRGSHLIITFEPHPQVVLSRRPFCCLCTLDKKIKLMRDLNMENLLILPFNMTLAQFGPEDFIDYILSYIKAKEVIVGANHRFGQGQKGSPKTLATIGEKRGIKLTVLPLTTIDGARISSSRIRKNIKLGTVCIANRLLGRRYSVKGRVIKGSGRGKEIGRPTANLDIPKQKCIPMDGVYVGRVRLGKKKYDCLISIGQRPTFKDESAGANSVFEVHILDFNREITGRLVEVYFVHFLRRHIMFNSIDKLQKAIDKDEKIARRTLKDRFIL
ncbi:riboflavin biosynthesis protein RibF [candidate division WOR-3 bacterium JGI_Cruoil_03_44_89]|uniref:Riboflavin biosynthesis protein n=1 Tax=candidate division WOR-3 bacterium JGI_Cruoil_03_44_89 TaxID=1973748 RepID=A0A235BRH7_UNCW3|nr:MAG: riboflavin biosynthesis protein RibF [candidate division WOR-3 bacterium JGI_Cruoil_03_44_89]